MQEGMSCLQDIPSYIQEWTFCIQDVLSLIKNRIFGRVISSQKDYLHMSKLLGFE